MNIGQTVYMELVKRAERGRRVCRVRLPGALFDQWLDEGHNINSLFRTLGVEIVRGDVDGPEFEERE